MVAAASILYYVCMRSDSHKKSMHSYETSSAAGMHVSLVARYDYSCMHFS